MRRALRALSAWLSRIRDDDRPPTDPFDAAVELARRQRLAHEAIRRRLRRTEEGDLEVVEWWR